MNKLWSRSPRSCSCVKAFQIDSVSSRKVSGGMYSRSASVPNFRCLVSITRYLLLSDLQRKLDLAKLPYWYFIFHTNIIPPKVAKSSKIYKDTVLSSPQIGNGYHFDILDRGVQSCCLLVSWFSTLKILAMYSSDSSVNSCQTTYIHDVTFKKIVGLTLQL